MVVESTITVGNATIGKIRLDPTDIRGEGNGHDPRLVIPIKIELHPKPLQHQIVIVRLSASLQLNETTGQNAQFASKITNDTIYNMPIRSVDTGTSEGSLELHFNLTHAQLKALENMRHEPGKKLYLRFEPIIAWNKFTGNSMGVRTGEATIGAGGWSTDVGMFSDLAIFWNPAAGLLPLILAEMKWVEKIFPGVGYDNFRLIEVKLPISSARFIPEDAVGHFKKAMQNYDRGVPEDSLRECRLAHEAIENEIETRLSAELGRVYKLGRDHKLGEAIALDLGWTPDSEQQKFVDGAWKPLYVMANASSHTPSTKSLLPADAHAVLLSTAVMLEYLAQFE